MRILGISGGIHQAHEESTFALGKAIGHDAAAVLIEDGKIVAAIEEERLNRMKHTHLAPVNAMRFCLDRSGLKVGDIDYFAYYAQGGILTAALQMHNFTNINVQNRFSDYPSWLRHVISETFDCDIEPHKLKFVGHHLAHAMSAFGPSGFDSSLVFTIDAQGEREAGMILLGNGIELKPLRAIPIENSLGFFYVNQIPFIGFEFMEEYKVMGLAPYGDPRRYRSAMKSLYDLLPKGNYVIHQERYYTLHSSIKPRKKQEEITQAHMDFAASLQEALETIVFHMLSYFKTLTGEKNLCLAGGVTQNCTLNGKILRSGMFEKVFVQPAAYDAGCAIGAALYVESQTKPSIQISNLEHMYLGSDIGEEQTILSDLLVWNDFIDIKKVDDVCQTAAELMAEGKVIGWVQGRSEFGPRALGNRSILADPRPSENKDIINAMVKKREAFRPFAPSVLEEEADLFFEMPKGVEKLPYMSFVVKVREERQATLGAVTHFDGTARIQTVSKDTNERFWTIINAFKNLTGIPILLNTSFNNNAEPIVNSVEDAVVCFLTTQLHYLFVGDYMVSKKEIKNEDYLTLIPSLPRHLTLRQNHRVASKDGRFKSSFEIICSFESRFNTKISPSVFELLLKHDGSKTLASLTPRDETGDGSVNEGVLNEILELWSRRLIALRPQGDSR